MTQNREDHCCGAGPPFPVIPGLYRWRAETAGHSCGRCARGLLPPPRSIHQPRSIPQPRSIYWPIAIERRNSLKDRSTVIRDKKSFCAVGCRIVR